MTNERRKIIAFIAARLLTDKKSGSVYDFQTSKFTFVSGEINDKKVNVYDHDRHCYLSGTSSGKQFSLYDFGDNNYTNLELKSKQKFEGYDFGTNSYFSGTVNKSMISFYDFQTTAFYDYSI
ncbi:hypothetical protein [Chitinophaga pinensis]|uniref:Uncharacterized protein n=1 Tax=Chitinophaga pinensis (strain ATCC 43595 / DSM 2588 / LMG 13176 / NBRC 15968 / NCIMB 11800 / UQM 2034) TaxID=485918 RepID=A0A979GQT6_CHIPD|nr:hypothetical protein [Chitinophaga pinensis]ACU61822.1 hypothetical protein Cpin_4375 [Chitinophaga pinensis DSM 2588]